MLKYKIPAMLKYQILVLGAAAIILMGSAGADTVILTPTDDMYSDPEHPGAHALDELWVANYSGAGHFQRIMIQFDLSGIEPTEIQEAYLHLYRFFVCPVDPNTITDMYAITQQWDEDTWPEDQHIAHGIDPWTTFAFGPEDPSWYSVDITQLVSAWVAGEIDNHGLVIVARTGEKWSKFYTKEQVNPALRPYLEVVYTSSGVEEDPSSKFLLTLSCTSPSSNGMTFHYVLPKASSVALDIYDLSGRTVRHLFADDQAAGEHQVLWRGRTDQGVPAPAGIYFCVLRTASGMATRRATLLR